MGDLRGSICSTANGPFERTSVEWEAKNDPSDLMFYVLLYADGTVVMLDDEIFGRKSLL